MKSKILTLLLSLAISFGLWLYVVTVISPESEAVVYDIPVELVGKDYLNNQNLMVISSTDNIRVDLTLSGNRSDLKKLNSSNVTVIVDLSKITQPGEHQLDCSVSFQSGTADVLAQKPERITVVVAEKLTKTVRVEPDYIGGVPDGYEENRNTVSMDHTTVTVSGPKETIDKIASARITVDLSGKMTTFVGDYPMVLYGFDKQPIADVSFVTANVSHIRAVVQVNRVKKVLLDFVPDTTNSGLHEDMVTLDPVVNIVTLIGSNDALANVGDVLEIPIKLSNYTGACTETFTLDLPEGVQCLEEIKVYIRIPEMASISLTVEKFKMNNVPEGMNVRVTSKPTVEIWGPKDVLDSLTADQILGVMDCTGVTRNTAYVPVTYVIEGLEYLQVRVDWSNVYITAAPVEK